MVLLHLGYLIRQQAQDRCNMYFLLWLQYQVLTKIIGRYEITSRGVGDNTPMAFSICILFGLSLSVNFILGLSLSVHPHPVCSPHNLLPVSWLPLHYFLMSRNLAFKLLHLTHQYTGCLGLHTVCLRTYILTFDKLYNLRLFCLLSSGDSNPHFTGLLQDFHNTT